MINKEVALTSRKLCKQSCSQKKIAAPMTFRMRSARFFSAETKIPCKDTSKSPRANRLC